MSKRIYIGNLPWSVTKDKLEELFSSFGEMEDALVVANKYTGRSRGFGFVTFKNDADADKAIEEMNEKEIEGRALVVKKARPRRNEEGASASDGGSTDKGSEDKDAGKEESKKEDSGEDEKQSEEKSEEKVEEKDEKPEGDSEKEKKEEKTVLEKEVEKEDSSEDKESGNEDKEE